MDMASKLCTFTFTLHKYGGGVHWMVGTVVCSSSITTLAGMVGIRSITTTTRGS